MKPCLIKKKFLYVISLAAQVLEQHAGSLVERHEGYFSCSMGDLVPQPQIEPGPPALKAEVLLKRVCMMHPE